MLYIHICVKIYKENNLPSICIVVSMFLRNHITEIQENKLIIRMILYYYFLGITCLIGYSFSLISRESVSASFI
jgi:hypothetical protein